LFQTVKEREFSLPIPIYYSTIQTLNPKLISTNLEQQRIDVGIVASLKLNFIVAEYNRKSFSSIFIS